MTKTQALAALNALESATMPGSAVLSFPGGVETWTIQLDPSHVYMGSQIEAVAVYCATNGLTLSAQFTALGIT